MNCKQNEIAVIVNHSPIAPIIGRFVTTLYVAPTNVHFDLPDGFQQDAINTSLYSVWWVVEFANPIYAPTTNGIRKTVYACIPDAVLRPIRDQPGEDEMLRIAGMPNKHPEVA